MNLHVIAASFVRSTARRATEGAGPDSSSRTDEWAVYQRDLEISRANAAKDPVERTGITDCFAPEKSPGF